MIFGLSYREKHKREQEKIKRWARGLRKFALFPVPLETGEWLWFQFYWSYAVVWKSDNGVYYIESSSGDMFIPKCHRYAEPVSSGVLSVQPVKCE